jgi:hypothetical protein
LALLFLPQPDFAEHPGYGNDKILIYLIVQIFAQQERVVFIALGEDILGLLGDKDGKREAEKGQDQKTGKGEKLDKPELPPAGAAMRPILEHVGHPLHMNVHTERACRGPTSVPIVVEKIYCCQ